MASSSLIIALVAATVLVTAALLIWRPLLVRDFFYEPIEQGRTILGLLLVSIGAWVALNSGVAYQMFIALLGIAFVVSYIYFEQPHEDIR